MTERESEGVMMLVVALVAASRVLRDDGLPLTAKWLDEQVEAVRGYLPEYVAKVDGLRRRR